jgi:hypothetical protein
MKTNIQYLTDEEKRDKIIEIINHKEGIAMAVETLSARRMKADNMPVVQIIKYTGLSAETIGQL